MVSNSSAQENWYLLIKNNTSVPQKLQKEWQSMLIFNLFSPAYCQVFVSMIDIEDLTNIIKETFKYPAEIT